MHGGYTTTSSPQIMCVMLEASIKSSICDEVVVDLSQGIKESVGCHKLKHELEFHTMLDLRSGLLAQLADTRPAMLSRLQHSRNTV